MHLTCFKLGPVQKFLEYVQEAMPLRIKAVHILNANFVFYKILAMARIFIKSELMNAVRW
jgi:hypothetical protein